MGSGKPQERIDPAELGDTHKQTLLHQARYKAAAAFMPDQGTILDLACGTGYGSILLHQKTGLPVIGVDYSWAAIQLAMRRGLGFDQVSFIEADILHWAPWNRADGLVCLETIEHLKDPRAFLSHIQIHLNPDARVCLSAPVDEEPGLNPYHLHQFNQDTLLGLFQEYFKLEAIFDQICYQTLIGRL